MKRTHLRGFTLHVGPSRVCVGWLIVATEERQRAYALQCARRVLNVHGSDKTPPCISRRYSEPRLGLFFLHYFTELILVMIQTQTDSKCATS